MAKRLNTIEDYFKETDESGVATYLVATPPLHEIRKRLQELSDNGIEITITFRPELRRLYTSATLTRVVCEEIEHVTKKHKSIKCIIIGEYSKTGMYHMHGSIKGEPRGIHAVTRRLHGIGRIEIKMIKFAPSWVDYILKFSDDDRVHTKEIIKEEYIEF